MAAYIIIGGELLDFDEFVAKYGNKKTNFQGFKLEEIDCEDEVVINDNYKTFNEAPYGDD